MKANFERIFTKARERGIELKIDLIGERPCMGNVDISEIERLTSICRPIIEDTANVNVVTKSSSTDCNIPLSLGIPALCIGVYRGGRSHTREEWVEKASLPTGLEIGIKVALEVIR